jgi:hypothetical protein
MNAYHNTQSLHNRRLLVSQKKKRPHPSRQKVADAARQDAGDVKPDPDMALQFLRLLVGPTPPFGLAIEMLCSDPYDDKPKHAKRFGPDQLEEAVEWGIARNLEGRNIFTRLIRLDDPSTERRI